MWKYIAIKMACSDAAQSTSSHPTFHKDIIHPEFDDGGNVSKEKKGKQLCEILRIMELDTCSHI